MDGSPYSAPRTGPAHPEKVSSMMRKASLILFGAAAGVAATLLTTQPRLLLEGPNAYAAPGDYRQLSLFGAVLERVRSDYVEKPDERKLIESAINGMLAGWNPTPVISIPKVFATCRWIPGANSAVLASRSRWRKA